MAIKHYFCKPVDRTETGDVLAVKVQAGEELHAGQVVKAEVMDETGANGARNFHVYNAETPSVEDDLVLLVNEHFEELEDGRRPEGQPDYTQYTFKEGTVVTGVNLVPNRLWRISRDCVNVADSVDVKEGFLVPDGTTKVLEYSPTKPTNTRFYFAIVAKKGLQLGGKFGGQTTSGFGDEMVAKVKINYDALV